VAASFGISQASGPPMITCDHAGMDISAGSGDSCEMLKVVSPTSIDVMNPKCELHPMTIITLPLRRAVGTLLRPAALGLLGVSVVPAAYLGVLTAAALGDRRSKQPAPGTTRSRTRFAVLVPAHNESRVIGSTVASLVGQRYSRDHFTVNVVADNCSDDTADRARLNGALAFERAAPDEPGKGPALNWLVEEIGLDDVDAVVIVDADTVADPKMLAAFDRAFAAGASVVQGDYGVLDPDSTPAVALRFAALACRHRLRPLGRTRLGASCGLYGNGMAFGRDLLERRGWSQHLVEDAEFQLDLLLDGIAVTYCPDARLHAEMPTTWDGAVTQHQRWELGRAQLLRRFTAPLARAVATGRGRDGRRLGLSRRSYADALIDLLVPPLSLLVALQIASAGVSTAAHVIAPTRRSRRTVVASIFLIGVTFAHVIAALRIVEAPRSVWRALSSAPTLVLWKLGLLAGIVRRPDAVSWQRTERNVEALQGNDAAALTASSERCGSHVSGATR